LLAIFALTQPILAANRSSAALARRKGQPTPIWGYFNSIFRIRSEDAIGLPNACDTTTLAGIRPGSKVKQNLQPNHPLTIGRAMGSPMDLAGVPWQAAFDDRDKRISCSFNAGQGAGILPPSNIRPLA
jgi:hypothetical protein